MGITSLIEEKVKIVLNDLNPAAANVPTNIQLTRKEFVGQYTVVVFPYTIVFKDKPENIGHTLGQALVNRFPEVFIGFNVVKGFCNLALAPQFLCNQLPANADGPNLSPQLKGQKIVVEFSSPNTNKPIHLGHLRNNFLGAALSNLLSQAGAKVSRVNLVNDRGIHICKSMVAYLAEGRGQTPADVGKKGDHFVGDYYVLFGQLHKREIADLVNKGLDIKAAEEQAPIMQKARKALLAWEQGEPETVDLWKKMNQWVMDGFKQTYAETGVFFDKYYFESETYLLGKDLVAEGLDAGVFYRKDDYSVWIDLEEEKLGEKILLRSDGTSVYITQDMGTAELKYKDYAFDRSVYVVGNEQDYHFKVLFNILEKIGRKYATGCYHLSYGMVELPHGKMKSREGTVVDADDLLAEMVQTAAQKTKELGKTEGLTEQQANLLYKTLALGALKFFLLKVEPKKKMMFEPEESIDFQGFTGPFVQYTHARICAVLRKAGLPNPPMPAQMPQQLHTNELELVMQLLKYNATLTEAAENYAPSVVANYVYELARVFNRFYAECPINNAENFTTKAFRQWLSYFAATRIKAALGILGIDAPEQM